MPFVSILLTCQQSILFLALLLVILALFSPVILILDSKNWQLRVRYLAALEFWMVLPGGGGERGISIAHAYLPAAAEREHTSGKAKKGQKAKSHRAVPKAKGVAGKRFAPGWGDSYEAGLAESSVRGPS